MQNIINLKNFRKGNHLSQEDVASFLGVSRPFISNVESGRNNLSDVNIDKLMNEGRIEKGWDVSLLNPPYYNLYALSERLVSADASISPSFDWDTGQSPLPILPRDMIEIKHGKMVVSDEIIDAIVEVYPYVNPLWVKRGFGVWALSPTEKKQQAETENKEKLLLKEEISALICEFRELLEKADGLLNRYNK